MPIVSIALFIAVTWVAVKLMRFQLFALAHRRWAAKFLVLDDWEMRELLGALAGFQIRSLSIDIAGSRASYSVDAELERIEKFKRDAADLAIRDRAQCITLFHEEMRSNWKAMKQIGDYDLYELDAELDYIFSNRYHLACLASPKLKREFTLKSV